MTFGAKIIRLVIFYPAQDDKDVPQALRQKIALAMLTRRRAFPKNLGEGIASIGQEIGDVLAERGVRGKPLKPRNTPKGQKKA